MNHTISDTTAQLQLPLGPFVQLMAVLCALTALVHLLLLLTPSRLMCPLSS